MIGLMVVMLMSYSLYFIIIINTLFEIGKKSHSSVKILLSNLYMSHHKRDSQITRTKICYTLVEPQPLPCTPNCGHEFYALEVYPHARYIYRLAFGIQLEVCGGTLLRKQPTR